MNFQFIALIFCSVVLFSGFIWETSIENWIVRAVAVILCAIGYSMKGGWK